MAGLLLGKVFSCNIISDFHSLLSSSGCCSCCPVGCAKCAQGCVCKGASDKCSCCAWCRAEPALVVNRATMTNLYTYFFHTTWPGATFPFSMRHVISSKVVDFKKNIYFCKLNYHMIQQFHFWIVIWRKWNHLSWKDICTPYSLQHCLQYLRYRNNLSIHQQVHGFKKCDIGPSMMVQGLTPCSSVGWSSIPAQGTRSCMPQLKMLHATAKIPCAPSKTWCNQINF